MKDLFPIVMMQLRNELDFGFLGTTRGRVSKIVFTILKFLIVAAVAFVLFKVLPLLIFFSGLPSQLMIFIYGAIFIMSVLSCTFGLMRALYFADDNKFLVTLPVNASVLFLSKLVVYYVFELKRSFLLTVPIFAAFGLATSMAWYYFPWLILVFVFLSAVPVLIGALLSIPTMFVYRFIKKRPPLLVASYAILIVGVIAAAVGVINLIPENINLIEQGGTIEKYMLKFLYGCEEYLFPVNVFVKMTCGRYYGLRYSLLVKEVPIYFACTLGAIALLGAAAFFASGPLFFGMISRTTEFEKVPPLHERKNEKRSKNMSYLNAEVFSLVRSKQFGTFLSMYIIVPVSVLLLNKIFKSMDTDLTGVYMVYAFNLLIIILPMLAVDSVVATLYSKDGRAAYVKKTFPDSAWVPLLAKLVPVFVLSAISIVTSALIFARFVELSALQSILLCLSLVGMQWGHVFLSGTYDLMDPKNEQYATAGRTSDNPNEARATISAFVVSVVYALFAFNLFPEDVMLACVKLCVIGVAFCAILGYMYFQKIRTYY